MGRPKRLQAALALAVPAVLVAFLVQSGIAQSRTKLYQFARVDPTWQSWKLPFSTFGLDLPEGLIETGEDGSLTLARFRGYHNTALDAHLFEHEIRAFEEPVAGGARRAGTNQRQARFVVDGVHGPPYWKPDPDAPLEQWWIEVDLGRATLVSEIRLIFPDEEGARPLSEFRVFASEGAWVNATDDTYNWYLVGGTTRPNTATEVRYDVTTILEELRQIHQDAASLVADEDPLRSSYDMLQHIRILVDAKTQDAALAEVEVYTPGENVALGTHDRAGRAVDTASRNPEWMFDGDLGTSWNQRKQLNDPIPVFAWDLGAVYWVNHVVFRASDWASRTADYGSKRTEFWSHAFLVSDGRRLPRTTASDEEEDLIDYETLFAGFPGASGGLRVGQNPEGFLRANVLPNQLVYRFPTQRVRWLKADWTQGGVVQQTGRIAEAVVLAEGVAEVRLVSDYLNLGEHDGDGRAKVIRSIRWDADLPEGTYVRVRSRTGSGLKDDLRYYDLTDNVISKEEWESKPKFLQGPTEAVQVPSEDWSAYSDWYREPGQPFLSPSPRRAVRLEVALGSARPDVRPVLHDLSVEYIDAFLTAVAGFVEPRIAEPGIDTTFTYTVRPRWRSGDPGFDRLLVKTPSPATDRDLQLTVSGSAETPEQVETRGDSLIVHLSRNLRQQEVELSFRAAPVRNATLVEAAVGRSQQPGFWQPVDADTSLGRNVTTVYLPSVAEADRMIHGLRMPRAFSPNDDGTGDRALIRFTLLRVDADPRVRVHDLSGRLVKKLDGERNPDQSHSYVWGGDDRSGGLAPPGTYVVSIELETQARQETITRALAVVY